MWRTSSFPGPPTPRAARSSEMWVVIFSSRFAQENVPSAFLLAFPLALRKPWFIVIKACINHEIASLEWFMFPIAFSALFRLFRNRKQNCKANKKREGETTFIHSALALALVFVPSNVPKHDCFPSYILRMIRIFDENWWLHQKSWRKEVAAKESFRKTSIIRCMFHSFCAFIPSLPLLGSK